MKIAKRISIVLAVFCIGINFQCSKSKGSEPSENQGTFILESSDLDLSKADLSVLVPSQSRNYTVNIKAGDDVAWKAYLESGNIVKVSPIGEQKGNGTITISTVEVSEPSPSKVIIERLGTGAKKYSVTFKKSNKILYFPEGTEGQTAAQFNNPASKYNVHYMVESENVAVLWEKSFGLDPRIAPRKFDQNAVLKASEEVYHFLKDELGFGTLSNSYSEKYKVLVFVNNSDNGGAFGGGNGNVGMLWVAPPVLQNPRFGIIYHELGHSFQYIARFDGAATFGGVGPFYEMTSQFVLLQKFPNWGELEFNHLDAYTKETHLALGHEVNQYRDPYMLEFWANKHGRKVVSKIWQETIASDNADFIAAYKRITGTSQEMFNDQRYEAVSKLVTWDIPSMKDTYAKYIGLHGSKLKHITGKTYQITVDRSPQNYGYNVIKLDVPNAGTKLQLNFQGMVGAQGFHIVNPDYQGWRYGFVALKKDKTRVYGDMGKATQGTLDFTVPPDTEQLWLVVLGAPSQHWKHIVDSKPETDNQWPYQFTLLGTDPHSTNF